MTYDFARGVELQLLRRTRPVRFLIRLVSNWSAEDFSGAGDARTSTGPSTSTLSIGRLRSKNYQGKPLAWSELRLKNLKDAIKKTIFHALAQD